jgi:hypothetical protein
MTPSPSPWRHEDASFDHNGERQTAAYVLDANGNLLAFISLGNVVPNAHLMAAAPDMLAALQQAMDDTPGWYDAVRAAIAKAKGTTP